MNRFWCSLWCVLLISLMGMNTVWAQKKKGNNFEFDWKTWNVSFAGGVASFNAEFTTSLQQLPLEMNMETSNAFSFVINKPVANYFSIGYELEIDQLTGNNPQPTLTAMIHGHPVLNRLPFNTPLLSETNITAHNLVLTYERPVWNKLSAFVMAKMGYCVITTELTDEDGKVIFEQTGGELPGSTNRETYPAVKEIKVAFGGGLSYAITDRFSIFGMGTTSMVQTDALDAVPNYNTGEQMTNVIGNYWSAKAGLTIRLQGNGGDKRSKNKRGNRGGLYLPWAPENLR